MSLVGKCPHCGERCYSYEDVCSYCGENLRQSGVSTSVKESSKPANVITDEPAQVKALLKRYWNAYILARAIVGLGTTIKTVGILITALIALLTLFLANQLRIGGMSIVIGVIGFSLAGVMGFLFYVWGILVSARGEALKATLDSAVNNSPLLTNEQRAKIMSLPKF